MELEATQREHAQDLASGLGSNDTPIHPLRLAGAVCEVMPRDTVLTFDAGDFVQWSRTLLPARRPGAWLRLGPMATSGVLDSLRHRSPTCPTSVSGHRLGRRRRGRFPSDGVRHRREAQHTVSAGGC